MTEKTFLPVATDGLNKAKKMVANIKTPEQVDTAKTFMEALKKLFHKKGEFEDAFKASEIWVDADRKLFEMIGGPTGRTEQEIASSLDITKSRLKNLRHELKRAYGRPDNEIKELRDKAFNAGALLTRKWYLQNGAYGHNTKEQRWFTPLWVYSRCAHIMGGVNLDPASEKEALEEGNYADRIFTKEQNGLKQDWGEAGNVFINPPFTCKDLRGKEKSGSLLFFKKLMASDFKQAMFLTPEDSGSRYGQALWRICDAVFIQTRRIKFIYKLEKDRKANPPAPSLIFGIFVCPIKFWLAFRGYGHIVFTSKSRALVKLEYKKRKAEFEPFLEKLKVLPAPPETNLYEELKDSFNL